MALRSFIEIERDSHFPLENLPFGVFKPRDGKARVGVALGDYVVDLAALQEAGHFPDLQDRQLFARDSLNEFLALGRPVWRKVRETLQFEPEFDVGYGIAEIIAALRSHLLDDVDTRPNFYGNYELPGLANGSNS